MSVAENADTVSIHGGEFIQATDYYEHNNTVDSHDRHETRHNYTGLGFTGVCLLVSTILSTFVLFLRPDRFAVERKLLANHVFMGAFHDSLERFDPPRSHTKTERAILNEIKAWANQPINSCLQTNCPPSSPPILWLRGSAGTGKSSIAQTLSEDWKKEGRLAARFFLSRAAASRYRVALVISTIAYQLAVARNGHDDAIMEEIRKDPLIFSKSMKAQVAALIERPFENLGRSASTDVKLIVIDGLDEIVEPREQEELLEALGSMITQKTLPLRLLVSGRPEPAILSVFKQLQSFSSTRLFDLNERQAADGNVEIFLRSGFTSIKKKYPRLNKPSWPSDNDIRALVEQAAGLIIYASVVMDYLDDDEGNPEELLKVVVGHESKSHDQYHPFAALDELYIQILSSLPKPTLEFAKDTFAHVITIQTCPDSTSSTACSHTFSCITAIPQFSSHPKPLNGLFLMEKPELDRHLKRLHSIIKVDEKHRPRISESFLDFITDPSRARQFYLEGGHLHARASLLRLKRLLFWSPPRFKGPNLLIHYDTGLSCCLKLAAPWEELVQGVLAVVEPEDEVYFEYAKSIRPNGFHSCRDRKDVLAEGEHEMFEYLHRWKLDLAFYRKMIINYRLKDWEVIAMSRRL